MTFTQREIRELPYERQNDHSVPQETLKSQRSVFYCLTLGYRGHAFIKSAGRCCSARGGAEGGESHKAIFHLFSFKKHIRYSLWIVNYSTVFCTVHTVQWFLRVKLPVRKQISKSKLSWILMNIV